MNWAIDFSTTLWQAAAGTLDSEFHFLNSWTFHQLTCSTFVDPWLSRNRTCLDPCENPSDRFTGHAVQETAGGRFVLPLQMFAQERQFR